MLETSPQIIETYVATGKVRVVYHHLIDLGEASLRGAVASECAGEQEQFWDLHGVLYQNQRMLAGSRDIDATLRELAAGLPLDQEAFASCLASGRHVDQITAQHERAKSAGISQRPTFELNGRRLVGALPYGQFASAINEALAGE